MRVTYIDEDDVKMNDISEVHSLRSAEDVATLINTYMDVRDKSDYKCITGVYENGNGGYIFAMRRNPTGFDILTFINEKYRTNANIKGDNIGYMFPRTLSRSIGVDVKTSTPVRTAVSQVKSTTANTNDPVGFRDRQTNREIEIDRQFVKDREFVIGRSVVGNLDYRVEDRSNPPMISKTHCKMYYSGRNLYIEDAKSTNGTFVNGIRIAPFSPMRVFAGDTIKLAEYELEVI